MISKISAEIIGRLIDTSIINNTEKELYSYGLFILLSQILYFILTISFGVILDIFLESVIFYVAFQSIRTIAGGIHASSELKCEVATTLSLFLCLGVVKLYDFYNLKTATIILTIVAAVFILILCPLDTPEKPLNSKEKTYFRKKSWIILLIILTIIGIFLYFEIDNLIYPCSMSLILESVLLVLGKIKEIKKRMDNNAFGIFLKEKRQQSGLSLRALGKQVGLSHIYLYNIENGKKAPPNDVIIKHLAFALGLDEKNKLIFFDTAAQCKSKGDSSNYYMPVDISQYLNENEDVKNVIREANQKEHNNSFWNDLLKELKE